jgi:DNA-binding XRE family transcriptional regulator
MIACPECGSREYVSRHPERYHYRECGLDNVWLEGGGVLEMTCKGCRTRYHAVLQEWQLLQVIALGLLMKPGFLRGGELRHVREECDLTQMELARRLRLARRQTVTEWEDQDHPARTEQTEYALRAVLLDAFEAALTRPGNNFLASSHLRALERFRSSFPAAYRHYFTRRPRRTLRIRKDRHWRAPEMVAA